MATADGGDGDASAAVSTPAAATSPTATPVIAGGGRGASASTDSVTSRLREGSWQHLVTPNTGSAFDTNPTHAATPGELDPAIAAAAAAAAAEAQQARDGVKILHQHYVMGMPWLTELWDFRGQKRIYYLCGMDPFWPLVLLSLGTLYSSFLLACLVICFWGCVIIYTFQQQAPLADASSDSDTSSDDEDEDWLDYANADSYRSARGGGGGGNSAATNRATGSTLLSTTNAAGAAGTATGSNHTLRMAGRDGTGRRPVRDDGSTIAGSVDWRPRRRRTNRSRQPQTQAEMEEEIVDLFAF